MIIRYHRRFRHDVKKLQKSGMNMDPLRDFISACERWPLLSSYQTHQLSGDKVGMWDAHIRHNWVVLFEKHPDHILLLRTGTHAALGIG
ncbi:MAG: type II toxin-antitoxin system YafQ family toxin [Candidatus Peribacteraceae bacterium]|nr:type II toxin-antitoxin system YafQ family toxin [Candidatus Peribacteraceae bacterium]